MQEPIPLGKLARPEAKRDAIHVAIIPVIADHDIMPGVPCGLIVTEPDKPLRASMTADSIGIVDPFYPKRIKQGERFYLCLYPNTVTGMRHCWSHPAFDEEPRAADTLVPA